MPKAYVLVDTKISNSENYEIYKSKAKPIAEKFGGKYLTRGGDMDIVPLQNTIWNVRLVIVSSAQTSNSGLFVAKSTQELKCEFIFIKWKLG